MSYFIHYMNMFTSKSSYRFFFTAYVAIATLYLISLIEVVSLNFPIDIESHKLKYAVEYELKKEISFSDLECSFEMKTYQDCKLAKYSNEITSKSLEALYDFQKFLAPLFFLTGFFSITGFILNPFIHNKYLLH